MTKLIGNTPMIKINYEYQKKEKHIFAKLEYYNFTGSIKDRMASYILKSAKEDGSSINSLVKKKKKRVK